MALIVPLKKSPEYRAIRPRVASPMAVDSWQDGGVHFFVFQLNPLEGAVAVPNDPPVVVFAMNPEEPGPLSAVVVTPKPGGEEADVLDLRQPDSAYSAAYAEDNTSTQDSELKDLNGAGANKTEPGGMAEHAGNIETASGESLHINEELLAAVKASPEFKSIEARLAMPLPTDSWQEDDAHLFAFQLLLADGSSPNGYESPVAVFAMRPPDRVPISAVVITPHPDGEDAEVADLRQPDSPYVASLSG